MQCLQRLLNNNDAQAIKQLNFRIALIFQQASALFSQVSKHVAKERMANNLRAAMNSKLACNTVNKNN